MKQDITTKILEEYSDIFADIGNVNLYGGRQVISPDDLELLPSNLPYQDLQGKHRELRSDVRMKVKKAGMEIAIICAENQTGICNTMPVRDMGYEYASYQEQIRKIKDANKRNGKKYFTKEIGDEDKLIPVIPLILYFGKERWTKPLSLMDMFNIPDDKRELVEPLIQNHYIRVIHLGAQDKATRKKYRSDFRYVVEYLACRDNEKEFEQFISEDTGSLAHPDAFLDVMEALTNDKRYQQIKTEIKKSIEKGEAINMCPIAEKFENQGVEKGMNAVNLLIERLMADGREKDLLRSAGDPEFQKRLIKEYQIL